MILEQLLSFQSYVTLKLTQNRIPLMKDALITLIVSTYIENLSVNTSNKSEIAITAEQICDIESVVNDIRPFLEEGVISDFVVYYKQEEKVFELKFTVPYGWKDGLSRPILE